CYQEPVCNVNLKKPRKETEHSFVSRFSRILFRFFSSLVYNRRVRLGILIFYKSNSVQLVFHRSPDRFQILFPKMLLFAFLIWSEPFGFLFSSQLVNPLDHFIANHSITPPSIHFTEKRVLWQGQRGWEG